MSENLHWWSCCLRKTRALIPVGLKPELKELLTLTLPVILSNITVYMISFVSSVFCGHLGRIELDSVALAIAVLNVTGAAVGYGLASACNTLISQTFGSGNLPRIGVIVQRAFLILMLACFPRWAILINTESLLLAVKQSPRVARLTQIYVEIYMTAVPALFAFILETSYLQNQGIIWPQVLIGSVANVLNALINYIFLFVLDFGVGGSAAANAITLYTLAILLFVYIRCKGLHKETWHGWTTDSLQEWDAFFYLAMPGVLMMCAEWWIFELGAFLAGFISEVELGAQSVFYELANVALLFPIGIGVAGSVRVGNALGAGDTVQAQLSAKLTMAFTVFISMCLATIIGSSKNVISYIFSNDEHIRERVIDVMVFYAPFHLFDGISVSAGHILTALGKQSFGAAGKLIGFYCIGFPIAVSLMFAAKLGIYGLWIGFLCFVIIQAVFFLIVLIKLNWTKATEEAKIRAGVNQNETVAVAAEEHAEHVATAEIGSDTLALAEEPSDKNACTVGKILPLRILVIRRGLTVLVMFSILGTGFVIYAIMKK